VHIIAPFGLFFCIEKAALKRTECEQKFRKRMRATAKKAIIFSEKIQYKQRL